MFIGLNLFIYSLVQSIHFIYCTTNFRGHLDWIKRKQVFSAFSLKHNFHFIVLQKCALGSIPVAVSLQSTFYTFCAAELILFFFFFFFFFFFSICKACTLQTSNPNLSGKWPYSNQLVIKVHVKYWLYFTYIYKYMCIRKQRRRSASRNRTADQRLCLHPIDNYDASTSH